MFIEIATVLFEVALLFFYLSGLFHKPSSKRGLALTFYGVFGALLVVLSVLPLNPLFRILYSIISVILLGIVVYGASIARAIYASLMCFVLAIIADIVGIQLFQLLGFPVDTQTSAARVAYIVVAKLLHLIGLQIVVNFVQHRSSSDRMTRLLPLISGELISIFICHRLFLTAAVTPPVIATLELFGILYINVIICLYAELLTRMYEKRRAQEETQQKFLLQQAYYERFLEHREETRALWHDIRKHLLAMSALVDEQQTIQANACMQQAQTAFASIRTVVDVGNPVINAILDYGVQKAEKHDIKIDMDIWIPKEIGIAATDLCIMIGNTLDNAIEACTTIPGLDQRKISLRLRQQAQMLYYEISNPYILAGKKQGQVRGYGLKNVKKCVEQHNGIFSCDQAQGQFLIQIQLNLP